jgi:hypothetical protein
MNCTDCGTENQAESVTNRAIDDLSMREHTVTGKSEPVGAWKTVRVFSMVRGKSEDGLRPQLFEGRERGLRLLKDTLTDAVAERRTRHVAIIGEGGVGKTRLEEELKTMLVGQITRTGTGTFRTLWAAGLPASAGEELTG